MLEARYPSGGVLARGRSWVPKPERGPRRWKRWAEMVAGGMSKAEVARVEGVSRVAVTNAFRKLKN